MPGCLKNCVLARCSVGVCMVNLDCLTSKECLCDNQRHISCRVTDFSFSTLVLNSDRCAFSLPWIPVKSLCSFPVAAVINYHILSGFKHRFINYNSGGQKSAFSATVKLLGGPRSFPRL